MTEQRVLIYEAVDRERTYQAKIHFEENKSVGEWILIIEGELKEAKMAWIKNGNKRALEEILQVVACGVAAMEQHGIYEEHSP